MNPDGINTQLANAVAAANIMKEKKGMFVLIAGARMTIMDARAGVIMKIQDNAIADVMETVIATVNVIVDAIMKTMEAANVAAIMVVLERMMLFCELRNNLQQLLPLHNS